MKYIIFKNIRGDFIPIIFPDWLEHADIAKRFQDYIVYSAGKFILDTSAAMVFHGDSISLGIKSQKDDITIFKQQFEQPGGV